MGRFFLTTEMAWSAVANCVNGLNRGAERTGQDETGQCNVMFNRSYNGMRTAETNILVRGLVKFCLQLQPDRGPTQRVSVRN